MKKETKKMSNIRKRTHKEVDNIMDRAKRAEERSKEKIARLKAKAIMIKGNVNGYIKKNPEKAVLIAAGTGVATGVFTTTMMRRKH